MFSHCDMKQDFWTLPWIKSEIVCLTAVFLSCSLFSYEYSYSDFGNTYKQATRTPLIPITSITNRVLNRQMY